MKCPVFIADVPKGCSRVGDPNYPDYVNCTNSPKVRKSPAGFGGDLGRWGGGGGVEGGDPDPASFLRESCIPRFCHRYPEFMTFYSQSRISACLL